jgi:hypothetical protein
VARHYYPKEDLVDLKKRTDEAYMDLEKVGMVGVDVDIAEHAGGSGGAGGVDVD